MANSRIGPHLAVSGGMDVRKGGSFAQHWDRKSVVGNEWFV